MTYEEQLEMLATMRFMVFNLQLHRNRESFNRQIEKALEKLMKYENEINFYKRMNTDYDNFN